MKKTGVFLILFFVFNQSFCQVENKEVRTFINPLLSSGSDPWIIFKDGFYYNTNTSGNRLFMRKIRNLYELKSSDPITIWTPPNGTSY
jgi:GH43 family beta-xylosidase